MIIQNNAILIFLFFLIQFLDNKIKANTPQIIADLDNVIAIAAIRNKTNNKLAFLVNIKKMFLIFDKSHLVELIHLFRHNRISGKKAIKKYNKEYKQKHKVT
jgi:hypothetical protein